MRYIILALAILALPLFSRAGNITPEQASQVAVNFYYERANIANSLSFDKIHVNSIRKGPGTSTAYYICAIQPKGFVLVSAADNVIPVLAYSFESNYLEDNMLQNGFNIWMDHYQQQIEYAIENNIPPNPTIINEWQRLLSTKFIANDDLSHLQNVEPLLVSKWNQDSPYNSLCPLDPAGPGGRCYAGCVATAMGQLLYYYRFPQQGQGSYSYTHPIYGNISSDFGATTYHWEGMPSSINKENDPIGEMLFQQGVSVDMDYGPDGSGMWNHKAAYSLKTYFRYGPETQYYFRDSVTIDWDSLLITNLDQRKPLYYAGWAGVQSTSGHAFVCDGYQPGNYYHFNWGWGGSQDGYFYTANLSPGGNNFNFAQEAIPLFPDTVQNTYPAGCQSITTLTSLRGSVEDGSGWYNYQNNSDCSWLISPQNSINDSVESIKITFLRFDTEAGADTLFLYDGSDELAPLLAAFSGNTIPEDLSSTGNKLFIKFHSNSSISKGGWQLDYESIIPVYCSGITTLNAAAGTVDDGSGSKFYNNNSLCRWKIMPGGGMPLTFNFSSFETSDSTDIVKIIDLQTQEILGTFSGNSLPMPVTATSGKILIIFITGDSGNAQGWSGNYYTSGVGISETDSCKRETIVYPNPSNGGITIEKFFSSETAQELTISVVDLKGTTIYSKKFKQVPGFNTFSMNLEDMTDSIYYLIFEAGNQKEMKKIVVAE